MRRNFLAASFLVITTIFITCLNDARSNESEEVKQVTCSGKVVDEQGGPMAGVKISLHEMIYDEAAYIYDPKLIGEIQTGSDGVFSFTEIVKDNQYRYAYVVAEKDGLALGFDNWSMRDGDMELEIKLGPSKELAGVIVDEKDIPVSDAEVSVLMLVLGEGRERKNLNSLVVPKLLTTNTDAAGKFVFTRIPAGATAEFIVEKPGKATISTYKRPREPYQKLNFTEGQKDIKLTLPVEAKIEGLVVEKDTGKPIGGVQIRYATGQEAGYFRPKPLVSKQDGTFTANALIAAQYVLALVQSSEELPDWVADRIEVFTEAGTTKSGIKMELSKGGVLEVKLTDAVSKEPVEDARISVNNQATNRTSSGHSDRNGMARMRLMAGDYRTTYLYRQGYSRQRPQDTFTIEDGKTERLEYGLAGMPKITGVVRDEKASPIEGVELEMCPGGGREEAVSDAEGRFEVIYDSGSWPSGRTPVMFLIGRHYQRNLAATVQVDEDTRALELKLEPALMITGQIVDPNGKGMAEVEVRTILHGPRWGSTIGRKPVITDKDGKYEIKAIPPGHEYSVYAQTEGYGQSRSGEISTDTAVDNRLDMGRLTLVVANLSISGIVVDDSGEPVPGVRVSGYGDNQPNNRYTQTDKDGKFTLEKVCAGRIRLSASKTVVTRLSGSVETDGGATDVRIVISERSSAPRYEPKRPPSLIGRPLPELKEAGIDLPPGDTDGKIMLVCFFDMEQRPSRRCVTQLAKQAEQLKSKGVTVVAVQVSKIDQDALTQWKNQYNIPFPVTMVQSDAEKVRFAWGIRSLPWLILTDSEHIIRSAGFRVNQLNEKIGEMENVER